METHFLSQFQKSLHVLDVTGNGLTSVADLQSLHELKSLTARHNCLSDIMDLTQAVSQWYHLTNLELIGNPVCLQQKYREKLIAFSNNLGE